MKEWEEAFEEKGKNEFKTQNSICSNWINIMAITLMNENERKLQKTSIMPAQ